MENKLKHIADIFRRTNGLIYIIGNGGCASTADHFACDLLKRNKKKAISLCSNNAILTAFANDMSGEFIYVEQLRVLFDPEKDLLVALTTSGESNNIIKACWFVRSCGGDVMVITSNKIGVITTPEHLNYLITIKEKNQQESENSIGGLCHKISDMLCENI